MFANVENHLWFIVIAQMIGLLGMAIDLYAANQKSDQKLMRLIVLSSVVFSIHFTLLSALPAALSELLSAFRYYLADKYKKIWLGCVFIVLYIIFAVFVADNLLDTFPFIAAVIGTVAIFFLKGIPMRLLFILGQSLWVAYSLVVFSLGGVILYTTLVLMTAMTIYRLYKVKRS